MEMKESGKLVLLYKSIAYNEIRGRVWCLEAGMILAAGSEGWVSACVPTTWSSVP